MAPTALAALHHAAKSAVLAALSLSLTQLARTGTLNRYIAPKLELGVKLSALALFALAVFRLWIALRAWQGDDAEADCGCGAHGPAAAGPRQLAVYAMFLLPIVFGLLPAVPLGSADAARAGIHLPGAAAEHPQRSDTAADAEAFPFDEFTRPYAELARRLHALPLIDVPEPLYIETLSSIDLYRKAFAGHRIRLTGFVHRDSGATDGVYLLSRFAVSCCPADARAYGLPVLDAQAKQRRTDEWLTVEGVLEEGVYDGQPALVLRAEQTRSAPPPASPYVYLDPDF
ncbi:TIGR03943 family putative permease subunit [Paenibacillus pasadenensis]|uniref:TIGR03943 family protein n=1 Tax=Paenibacillus pasadenensis TaxID=217090 RepID=A0A2N5NAE4_9BACL|nr:TIGR03943 family protein [Paenibacillus pasadenensis]PLT47303.1 hypothetical protein B8V81_1527 [Paenibacillus pasadenensis]